MSLGLTLAFLACVALATAAQNLTGFAFALILVGLSGVFDLMPLPDAVNVAGALSLASAAVSLRGRTASIDRPALLCTAAGSLVGVGLGVLLLGWLSANVVDLLRVLLGLTVIACAASVSLRAEPLAMRSGGAAFTLFGAISGVLGGLFSSGGPPLVYHFFRQPLPLAAVRNTLVAALAVSSALRLTMVVPTGQFGLHALRLCLIAAPVVFGISWWLARHPPAWPVTVIRKLVGALLLATGLGLLLPALARLCAA